MAKVHKDLENFPAYLESYGSLLSHLESQFASMSTQEKSGEKGERFVEFVARLIPLLKDFQRFERPKRNKKKTHDKGIDLTCESYDRSEILFIQSKYTIPDVEEFDSIISKFQAYDSDQRGLSYQFRKGGNGMELSDPVQSGHVGRD